MTPPAVQVVPGSNGDWGIRVFPNKYPALSDREPLVVGSRGYGALLTGWGGHEVIVETRAHAEDLSDRPPEAIQRLLGVWRDRARFWEQQPHIGFVSIFRNAGPTAGATQPHAHSQLVALPIVPTLVASQLERVAAHRQTTGSCLVCQVIEAERAAEERVVYVDHAWVTVCPWASRVAFEIALYPLQHAPHFSMASDADLAGLSRALVLAAKQLRAVFPACDYNVEVRTGPSPPRVGEKFDEIDYHWHVVVVPRRGTFGGFELATGAMINHTSPEAAAARLRADTNPRGELER